MRGIILWVIKIVIILFVVVLMTLGKELGVPIFLSYMIGLGIIYAVWKYDPNADNNEASSDSEGLDKS